MTTHYVIETTREIKNPAADRRSKDWNKLPTIPAGSRFIVSNTENERSIRSSNHRYAWEHSRSTLGTAIEANSAKVEPVSVKELASVYNCDYSGDEILRILVKLGRVTPADFEAVANVAEDF